tara:strand:+ start:558 stop:926 length:369 start_codon:yes stop_codon:yes gene_type:complete
MATYAWTIDLLSTKDITKDGTTYSDVILRVNATLTGTSETIGSLTSDSGFDLDMDVSNIGSEFTAYGSVTEANVISWVENRMDADILANIKTEIEGNLAFLEKVNGSAPKEDTDGNATFPWS